MRFILLSLLLISLDSLAQVEFISEKLEAFTQQYPQEKVYVVTDRDTYVVDETIWFAVHLVDAQRHQPVQLSKIVYVNLVNSKGDVVASRNIEIIDGMGIGDIHLKGDYAKEVYTLNAYTNYMLNQKDLIFSKPIYIMSGQIFEPAREQFKVNVQFFPEGGQLVDGLVNLVGVKASDSNGNPVSIENAQLLADGEVVGQIKTNENGLGLLPVLPDIEKKYKVEIEFDGKKQKTDFPDILNEGFSLQARVKADQITLTISGKEKEINHKLIGHIRGQVIFEEYVDTDSPIKIPTANFPSGVLHITHFDKEERPRNERLVFIDNLNDQPALSIETGELASNFSENTSTTIDIFDENNNQIEGNYSLSILDTKFDNDSQSNIVEYLLLQSELKGRVHNISFYFDKNNEHRTKDIDLLMRTHGWSRYTWQDVYNPENYSLGYLPEINGYNLNFLLKNGSSGKTIEANLILSPLGMKEEFSGRSTKNGRVSFYGLNPIQDTLEIFLKANYGKAYKQKKNKVTAINDNIWIDYLNDGQFAPPSQQVAKDDIVFSHFEDSISSDPRIGQNYSDLFIEAVTIQVEKERTNPRFQNRQPYQTPDDRVLAEDYPVGFLFPDLLREIPGLVVAGTNFAPNIYFRRGVRPVNGGPIPPPLYVLDGIRTDLGTLLSFSVLDIDYIDILIGPAAAAYGSSGSNGVILVFTKIGADAKKNIDGTLNLKIPGYYQAREFYNPMFAEDEADRKLYSPTLFWEPKLGDTIQFQNPNFPAEYIIKVEGVTKEGRPVFLTKKFEVSR